MDDSYSYLLIIPNEILLQIFSYLDFFDFFILFTPSSTINNQNQQNELNSIDTTTTLVKNISSIQFISNEKINPDSNYQPIRFNLVCKNWNQIIQSPFFSNILFKSFFSRDFQFIIDLDPNIKYENVKDWKLLYFGN